MNLKEAKEITRRVEGDPHELTKAQGFLEATQAAEPLLRMIGKLREEADKYFSSLESGEDYTDSRTLHDAVRKSLQVEREYREKALGEK